MVNPELQHKICALVGFLVHSVNLVQLELLSTITVMVFANHVKINPLILTTMLLLRAQLSVVFNALMVLKQSMLMLIVYPLLIFKSKNSEVTEDLL